MFQIDCRDFRDQLSGKHKEIAQREISIIAERAKKTTLEILEKFDNMHQEIERKPEDIEMLTAIKEYIEKCHNELDKFKIEIKECLKIQYSRRFPIQI